MCSGECEGVEVTNEEYMLEVRGAKRTVRANKQEENVWGAMRCRLEPNGAQYPFITQNLTIDVSVPSKGCRL